MTSRPIRNVRKSHFVDLDAKKSYATPSKVAKLDPDASDQADLKMEESSLPDKTTRLSDLLQSRIEKSVPTAKETLEAFTKACMSITSGQFPRPLDLSNPAKSWWRYFEKQPSTNTAMCYTCGATFNRGPKQSTTSLSHHLKMYHQEHYIVIQQAKDEDMKLNPKNAKSTQVPSISSASPQEHGESAKKANFNINLINAVKLYPELYDPKQRNVNDEDDRTKVWEDVVKAVGDDVSPDLAKKRWLQIRDRYRKELKFVIRDNFAYTPKWPYFNELKWLDEFMKDSCTMPMPRRNRTKASMPDDKPNFDETLLQDGTRYLNDLLSACESNTFKGEESTASETGSTSDLQETWNDEHRVSSTPQNDTGTNLLDTITQMIQLDATSNFEKSNMPTNQWDIHNPFEWMNDEDMLFGRIIGLRFKNLDHRHKREMRIAIERLFEEYETRPNC